MKPTPTDPLGAIWDVEMDRKFNKWMRKQTDRDDRIGDLARDWMRADAAPEKRSVEQYVDDVHESLVRAKDAYWLERQGVDTKDSASKQPRRA